MESIAPNPLSTTAAFEVEESPRPPSELSAASETKAFGPGEELDPEVLSDLSYAFMAIDLDHSGTLEPNELLQLLRVLGNDDTIEVDECRQTIVDVKSDFKSWREANNITTYLPDEYQYPGTQANGAFEKEGGKRSMNALEQQCGKSLPEGCDPTLQRFYLREPMRMTKKAVSSGIAAATEATAHATKELTEGFLGGQHRDEERADQLRYAEFVHMMRTGRLNKLFPGQNWRSGAKQLHNYRKAFDSADVDGDDTLEQGEFELVMDTLHMGHDLTPAEVRHCWNVMKSARPKSSVNNHLTFVEFIGGVQAVRKDDVLGGRIDLTKPCPWELISLLIDTPVSDRETKMIEKNLSAIERVGLKMVSRMQITMRREEVRNVLHEAVDGRLHHLTEDKIHRLNTVWTRNVLQALMVSFISTGISCPAENLFSYWFRSDGLVDVDCLCYTRGCAVNPGSLGIDEQDLSPGDVTIPGRTWLSGECDDLFAGTESQQQQSCHRIDVFTDTTCTMGPNGLRDSTCPCDLSQLFRDGNGCNATCLQHCGFIPAWGPSPGTEQSEFWSAVAEGRPDSGQAPTFEPSDCYSSVQALTWFWIPLTVVLVVTIVMEFMALSYYGVMNSIQVAWALNYRLVPLNEDRAFLADSLVRGAMELGNPNNAVYGVDPQSDLGPPGKGRKILAGFMWKGKIVLTGVGIKTVLGIIFPWESMFWVKPWMSMPADMFWCAITAHVVIKQAQIRGIGVATVHEVFNEVMSMSGIPQAEMRDIFKLQLTRAIGVAIVKHGHMYPSMELILRHAVQWLGMKASPAVQRPGELDSEEKFLADMTNLTEAEMVTVLSIHLLTSILDGDLNSEEHELLERVFNTVPDSVGEYSKMRISWLAMQFRDYVPVTAELLRQAFQLNRYQVNIPSGWGGYNQRQFFHTITDCMTI